MKFDKKRLRQLLLSSTKGCFIEDSGKVQFVENSNSLLQMVRSIDFNNGGLNLSAKITNISKRQIKVMSVVICDFILPAENIKQILEHGWLQASPSKYKDPIENTRKNRVFMIREHNPFSFKEEYGYLKGSIVSEWFSVLRLNGKSLVIGALTTKNQFVQIFIKKDRGDIRIRVTSQFDGKKIANGEIFKTELVGFFLGQEEKSLKSLATGIANKMEVEKPRQVRGMCCSYYWNKNIVTEAIVNRELDIIASLTDKLNIDYIQIDAGYYKNLGDWLDYKERFPSGMKKLVKRINSFGYKAGIWISPFVATPNSKLFKSHSEWFLKMNGRFVNSRYTSPLDIIAGYEKLDLKVIDPTNKDFQKYLVKVFKHFIEQGFEFFKLDFLYPFVFYTNFYKNATRAEALREGLELIRKTVGENAYILSGLTPLSPLVGIVDSMRVGIDTLNPFVSNVPIVNNFINNRMLGENLSNIKIRNFLNRIVWLNDPDVLVFRKGTGISEKLMDEHKKIARDSNMALWIGDSLAELSKSELERLVKYFNQYSSTSLEDSS